MPNETQNIEKYEPKETQSKEVGGWDDYITGRFLKAENIENPEDTFEVIDMTEELNRDENKVVRLTLKCYNEEFRMDLNKTNSAFIKNAGILHPKDLKGKKLQFNKVRVFDPTKKMEVDGLRISKVI